ncbi:MAG: energy transducer TonB [Deltaproteobacteria bacterium]|nr:energy transducer TonB [Deltaproteobacteria bacterium]
MSVSNALSIALALSLAAHAGLGVAICHSSFLQSPPASNFRLQPVEVEISRPSITRNPSALLEEPAPIVTPVRRPEKRSLFRKQPAETTPDPRPEPARPEISTAENTVETSSNSEGLPNEGGIEFAVSASTRQDSSGKTDTSGMSTGPAGPRSMASAATNAGRVAPPSHWSRIRAAIERYIEYPRAGRRFGWEGKVLLRFKLLADGRVLEARVDRSSGFELLDRSALRALERAAPLPAPVAATEVIVPILFALK